MWERTITVFNNLYTLPNFHHVIQIWLKSIMCAVICSLIWSVFRSFVVGRSVGRSFIRLVDQPVQSAIYSTHSFFCLCLFICKLVHSFVGLFDSPFIPLFTYLTYQLFVWLIVCKLAYFFPHSVIQTLQKLWEITFIASIKFQLKVSAGFLPFLWH